MEFIVFTRRKRISNNFEIIKRFISHHTFSIIYNFIFTITSKELINFGTENCYNFQLGK